jgi:hypothetical protein
MLSVGVHYTGPNRLSQTAPTGPNRSDPTAPNAGHYLTPPRARVPPTHLSGPTQLSPSTPRPSQLVGAAAAGATRAMRVEADAVASESTRLTLIAT